MLLDPFVLKPKMLHLFDLGLRVYINHVNIEEGLIEKFKNIRTIVLINPFGKRKPTSLFKIFYLNVTFPA